MNESGTLSLDSLPLRDRRRPPAPRPPRGKLGLLALYRGLRNNPITTWGQEAYEQPILADRGLIGPFVIVNQPDAIRHVFLDNAANYRKDALQLEKLEPALGRGLLTRTVTSGAFSAAPLRRCSSPPPSKLTSRS
jgi:hypothetical protein